MQLLIKLSKTVKKHSALTLIVGSAAVVRMRCAYSYFVQLHANVHMLALLHHVKKSKGPNTVKLKTNSLKLRH